MANITKNINITQLLLITLFTISNFAKLSANDPKYKNQIGVAKNENIFLVGAYFNTQKQVSNLPVQNIPQSQLAAGISYFTSRNFDISIQSSLNTNSDSTLSSSSYDFALSGAYTIQLNPHLHIYPSYSHFFYSKNTHSLQGIFSDFLQTEIYYLRKGYSGSLSIGYAMGTLNTFQSSLSNSLIWQPEILFLSKSRLNIYFEANISFTDVNLYNEIIFDNWDFNQLLNWVAETYPIYYMSRRDILEQSEISIIKDRLHNLLENESHDIFSKKYRPSYMEFSLPLQWVKKKIILFVTPSFQFPLYTSDIFSIDPEFSVNAGFSFLFD